MAIEIFRVYKEILPAVRFVGKCYTNDDRINGSFGANWGKWFENNWFNNLEQLPQLNDIDNGYIGLMKNDKDGSNFQYWIGLMLPSETTVPEGYKCIDLPEAEYGICWIKGKEETGEIYGLNAHNQCVEEIGKNIKDKKAVCTLYFERYNCPRFTEKDTDGNVILDYGIYLE